MTRRVLALLASALLLAGQGWQPSPRGSLSDDLPLSAVLASGPTSAGASPPSQPAQPRSGAVLGLTAGWNSSPGPNPTGAPQPADTERRHTERPTPSGASRPAAVVGTASWFDAGPGHYAALPGYHAGTVVRLVVCGSEGDRSTCLTVAVVTSCQCYVGTPSERIVDLSRDAFAQLAPLSRGLVRVSIREVHRCRVVSCSAWPEPHGRRLTLPDGSGDPTW